MYYNFGGCIDAPRDAGDRGPDADQVWSIEEIVALLQLEGEL
jgi:hypothetical protein